MKGPGFVVGWLRAALGCALLCVSSACATATATSGGNEQQNIDPLTRVSGRELYERGEQLAHNGDPIRAEQYVSSAVQRGYPLRKALPLLLRLCVATSRLSAALQYATPYLRLHPDDYHLRYLVAAVQLGLGRAAEARRELELVVRQAPDFADAHYMLGVVLRDQGDAPGAAREFAAHQRVNPNGLHGAEVAQWLAEHDRSDASSAAPPPARALPAGSPSPAAPEPGVSATPEPQP